jgi:hypothetical protein
MLPVTGMALFRGPEIPLVDIVCFVSWDRVEKPIKPNVYQKFALCTPDTLSQRVLSFLLKCLPSVSYSTSV